MRSIHHSVFIAILMLSIYLLCASVETAQAKLYKWKDDSGATHYTDNENNIPFKYRNKNKLEKLKGLSKPKPIESETKDNPDSENPEEEIAPEAEATEENPDSESLAFLEEVKSYFETDIKNTRRILKAVPADVKNGKYIIFPLKAGANKKLELADKIKTSKIKALKPVTQYLISSGALDQMGEIGGNDYLARIIETKDRLEREVITKEKLLKMIEQEIKRVK
ncbi:MAG: DUF4124 domain-containing protein [Nitrospinales bacterium]